MRVKCDHWRSMENENRRAITLTYRTQAQR